MSFVRTLDTGMRRLGFLEVLLSDCAGRDEGYDAASLGDKLWKKSGNKQDIWLRELGVQRGLNSEVGRITSRIANRYVKLAAEMGFLTGGENKTLTDLGRTFKSFRKRAFFLAENPGQRILYIRELFLRRDSLIAAPLCNFVARNQPVRKSAVYDWFARDFVSRIVETKRLEEGLEKRLTSSVASYNAPATRRLGKDRIKHMLDTRLEHLVDLEVLGKSPGPVYFAKGLGQRLSTAPLDEESVYRRVAAELNVTRAPSDKEVANRLVSCFETLRQPPLYLVSLPTLHDTIIIGGIVQAGVLISPSQLERVERRLAQKFYGNVIFFEGKEQSATNLTISEPGKIKENLDILLDGK